MISRELTARQSAFVSEYLVDYNATQAAIRAGYSEKTAKEQASRLLSKVNVKQAVKEKQREIMKQMDLRAEDVINDVVRLKEACMAPDENGRPSDATNAVRCLTLLGNNLGTWKKERFSDEGVQYIVKHTGLSDSDDETPENVVKLAPKE